MGKGRLEAFSDGVIAIIITIMVLELIPPHGAEWENLRTLWPKFTSYIISFVFVGIYWNTHHHVLQAVKVVNGRVLWVNLLLLFSLLLIPFAAAWMGENHFGRDTVMLYGIVFLLSSMSFVMPVWTLRAANAGDAALHQDEDFTKKAIISNGLQLAGAILAFFFPITGLILLTLSAVWWVIPSRKIEHIIANGQYVF